VTSAAHLSAATQHSTILLDARLRHEIAGEVTVYEAPFLKRLGQPAFKVWQVMCRLRCKDTGMFHALRATLSREAGVSERVVKRAVVRLIEAGLVIDYGRRELPVALTRAERRLTAVVLVPLKIVYGARAVSHLGDVVVVPGHTLRWLNRPQNWGGSRVGAGRPAGIKTGPQLPSREIKMGPPTVVTITSTGDDVFPLRGKTPPLAGPVSLPPADTFPEALGVMLGGNGPSGPRPPPPGHGGVPAFPGPSVLTPATVPYPPRLGPDEDDLALAKAVMRAYWGACESRFKKRSWVLRQPGALAASKQLKSLVAGAKVLREKEIPPASWAAFSVDVWRRFDKKDTPPPLAWVFSPKRMEEREGWYREEAGTYGGRAVFPPAAKELLMRYMAMRRALVLEQVQTEDDVARVMHKYLPGDAYDFLVAKARIQSKAEQDRLNGAVRRGEWLW